MNFRRERVKDLYLRDTALENIFIAEFLPDAEANYIKVYLIALMYADVEEMTNSLIAKHLRLDEEEVLKAWNYWEKCGVIKKHYNDPDDRFHYTVEFISLKERIYSDGDAQEGSNDSNNLQLESMSDRLVSVMDDPDVRRTLAEIQQVIGGRLFEGREPEQIVSWMYDYKLSGEFIIRAYNYCA